MDKVGNHATFHEELVLFFIEVLVKELLAPAYEEVDPEPGSHDVEDFDEDVFVDRVAVEVADIDVNSRHADSEENKEEKGEDRPFSEVLKSASEFCVLLVGNLIDESTDVEDVKVHEHADLATHALVAISEVLLCAGEEQGAEKNRPVDSFVDVVLPVVLDEIKVDEHHDLESESDHEESVVVPF